MWLKKSNNQILNSYRLHRWVMHFTIYHNIQPVISLHDKKDIYSEFVPVCILFTLFFPLLRRVYRGHGHSSEANLLHLGFFDFYA